MKSGEKVVQDTIKSRVQANHFFHKTVVNNIIYLIKNIIT